ncbi:MAG: hypothetical protein L0219_02110 [Phycisphaerales bacterium]|nr:hypothetical protein [Phycisphaerales bacterium]
MDEFYETGVWWREPWWEKEEYREESMPLDEVRGRIEIQRAAQDCIQWWQIAQ